MRILVCGDRSFAARGLVELLRQQGHDVTTFNRGAVTAIGASVTGPVFSFDQNPHLAGSFDTVINYILLKDELVGPNVEFAAAVLRFCAAHDVKHLVHISSVSSYKASTKLITPGEEIEQTPENKGPYGALKVATDLHFLARAPATLKMSFIRPGFVLGPGLMNPIIGTAVRLPWNRVLIIGNRRSILPVISRELVNRAVAQVAGHPPAESRETLLLVAPQSPTREEFLQVCCKRLGVGKSVVSLPTALWWIIATGAEVFARVIGQAKLKPYSKLTARLAVQHFDASESTRRLGFEQSFDWASELANSFDGQTPNFRLDALFPASALATHADRLSSANGRTPVTFIGFGRIVKSRHLPALRRLKMNGQVLAYDPNPSASVNGEVQVRKLEGCALEDSSLFVVASPGPAHTDAIRLVGAARGPVIVEKPLCYTEPDLQRWLQYAVDRPAPVSVCHNYRFKKNVMAMGEFLGRYNSGRLHHVSVDFQSPPVSNDSVAWLRNERAARTLLMDYALHFLDLACMFSEEGWQPSDIRHEVNSLGQTSLIEGRLKSSYTVSFLLRQGFAPRRARLTYNFQNYSISLGFFPETFVPIMADDNPWLHRMEARASMRATLRKIFDRLRDAESDKSHAVAFALATSTDRACAPLDVNRLASFYRAVFNIGDTVYS